MSSLIVADIEDPDKMDHCLNHLIQGQQEMPEVIFQLLARDNEASLL